MNREVEIIAEIGVNHNGDLGTAIKLIDFIKEAGVETVKVQIFKSKSLASINASQAKYQKKQSLNKNQLSMLEDLELSFKSHEIIFKHCQEIGINYLASVFDDESLNFLSNLDSNRVKIASGEITNFPFLVRHSNKFKEIILSTGMSSLEEVKLALKIIDLGRKGLEDDYFISYFDKDFFQEPVSFESPKDISLLHCTSSYPARISDLNLNNITTLKKFFDCKIGYSDHTKNNIAAVIAVSKGAKILEKHVTLDKSMKGPDHQASIDIDGLKDYISIVNDTCMSLGSDIKACTESEKETKQVARKSVRAIKNIDIGETIDNNNIAIMRPDGKQHPSRFWNLLNSVSQKKYKIGDEIDQ